MTGLSRGRLFVVYMHIVKRGVCWIILGCKMLWTIQMYVLCYMEIVLPA